MVKIICDLCNDECFPVSNIITINGITRHLCKNCMEDFGKWFDDKMYERR